MPEETGVPGGKCPSKLIDFLAVGSVPSKIEIGGERYHDP